MAAKFASFFLPRNSFLLLPVIPTEQFYPPRRNFPGGTWVWRWNTVEK